MNFMTREREQRELDELMRTLGFGVVVAADTTTRPVRPAWYQGVLHQRPLAVTLVGRKLVGWNMAAGVHPGSVGNRNAHLVVVSIIMSAVGAARLGFGLHTAFGELPDPDPARLVGPDHPASGMPEAVRLAFHRFARGHARPADIGRSPHARYLRIVDRSGLADYLPPAILPTTEVLVMHELVVAPGWPDEFVPITNELGWVAHAIEATTGSARSRP